MHPCGWLRPGLVPPAPFLQCEPHLTPGGSGVLADSARIGENSERPGFPNFVALDKGRPSSTNAGSLGGWGWRELKGFTCFLA